MFLLLSLHTGYDTGYLTVMTDAVGTGVDYYLEANGGTARVLAGRRRPETRLAGQVEADVMRRLYQEDIGPDGQVTGPGGTPL